MYRGIKDLHIVLGQFLDILADRTGWSFTVIMGGPHPEKGGAIEIMKYVVHTSFTAILNVGAKEQSSHSVGLDHNGKLFPVAMRGFEEEVLQPWLNHLKLVYRTCR